MLLTSTFVISLVASALAVPVSRSDTGDKLLAALGNGVATGVGGVLQSGATFAVDTLVHEATGLLSKGLTAALGGIFGKRDLSTLVNTLQHQLLHEIEAELLKVFEKLEKRSLGEDIFHILEPIVTKEVEHLLGNLKLKRSKMGDELLAALTPQLTQAVGTITASALEPLTAELSSALSSLTSTAVKGLEAGITKGISSLGSLFG